MSATQVRAPMPGDRLPRQRGWMVGAAGLIALMIYIGWRCIEVASVPYGDYARHRRGWDVAVDGPWPFPYEEVRYYLIRMGVEGAVAIWVLSLRWPVSLAVRSMSIWGVTCLLLFFQALFAMHASGPFAEHLAWLVFAAGWMLAFAVASAVCTRVARWLRARRARRAHPLPPLAP